MRTFIGRRWGHAGREGDSVQAAREHLKAVGRNIADKGLPAELCPFTIGILGYGNVSSGAQQIFDCLPTRRIAADDINAFVAENRGDASRGEGGGTR